MLLAVPVSQHKPRRDADRDGAAAKGRGGGWGTGTSTNLEVPHLLFRQCAGQQEEDQTLRVRHARKDTQHV